MTRYGKYENDGLWLVKWMRWTMVDQIDGIDFGLWTQQRWRGRKMMQQNKNNWRGVHEHKQDSGTRWLHITPARGPARNENTAQIL